MDASKQNAGRAAIGSARPVPRDRPGRAMPVRSSTYLVLGMLRLGASSGYAIKKAADVSTRFFWATSFAQVYPELARLERERLVTRRDEPRGARRRSAYAVTGDGERALLAWLRYP